MSSFSAYMTSLFLTGIKKTGCSIKKCSFVPPSAPHFEFPTSKGLKITTSDKTRAKLKINRWLRWLGHVQKMSKIGYPKFPWDGVNRLLNMSRFSAYIYDKYIFNWNYENGVLIKKCSLFVPPSEPHFDFPTSKGLKITPSDKTRAKLKNLSLVIMAWSCIEENDNIFFKVYFGCRK